MTAQPAKSRILPREVLDHVQDAVSLLIDRYPHWGVEIHSIPWFAAEASELPDGATMPMSDYGVGFMVAEEVMKMQVGHLAARILHQMMHLMSESAQRSRGLGMHEVPGLHEYSQDLAINSYLDGVLKHSRTITAPPPEVWVLPEDFGLPPGKSYEDYFQLLLAKGVFAPDPRRRQGGNFVPPRRDVGSGNCGCGLSDQKLNQLTKDTANDPSVPEHMRQDLQNRSPSQTQEIGRSMSDKAAKHEPGSGSLRNLLPAVATKPTISWQEHLLRTFRSSARATSGLGENNYKRPNRRSPKGIFLPLQQRRIPTVAAIIDTSGSMGSGAGSELAEACTEVWSAAKTLNAKVGVYYCDDAVTNYIESMSLEDILAGATGGGGTAFTEAFEQIAALPISKRPNIIVVATDGYISPHDVPEVEPPGSSVIWVIVRGGRAPPVNWGTAVHVGQDVDTTPR